MLLIKMLNYHQGGSGGSSVDTAIASDYEDGHFESNHRQILLSVNCIEKTKINKKRPGMAHSNKAGMTRSFLR